jgi:hypothetical protein
MQAILKSGHMAEITQEGGLLSIYGTDGNLFFSIAPPDRAGFYQFVQHAIEGQCPIVSFSPGHEINGWSDWYYKVNVEVQVIERVNPWR